MVYLLLAYALSSPACSLAGVNIVDGDTKAVPEMPASYVTFGDQFGRRERLRNTAVISQQEITAAVDESLQRLSRSLDRNITLKDLSGYDKTLFCADLDAQEDNYNLTGQNAQKLNDEYTSFRKAIACREAYEEHCSDLQDTETSCVPEPSW